MKSATGYVSTTHRTHRFFVVSIDFLLGIPDYFSCSVTKRENTMTPRLIILLVLFALCSYRSHAQSEELLFHPNDTIPALHGYTPLRLFPSPPDLRWPGAALHDRGEFAIHSYVVPGVGPTTDRANEAVTIGWNPMGVLQPKKPGFWWQYEWNYGQTGMSLFELNLDVRDSTTLGDKPGLRRITYKINRRSGVGISADLAFNNFTFVEGNRSAGDRLGGNFLLIATRADKMEANLRTEFGKIVRFTVQAYHSSGRTLKLPMERGVTFSARLIAASETPVDSTHIVLNSMETGAIYTIKLRNERPNMVRLSWATTHGRRLYWDRDKPRPDRIERGETLIFRIIMDEKLGAFATMHGRFTEDR